MIYLLFICFSLVLGNIINTDSTQCDCGFQDNTTTIWSEVWHLNFENQVPISNLHTVQELFFANYTVGAKHNDSLSRVFSRENVDTIDNAMRIAVSVDQTSKQITCGGFGTKRQSFLYGSFRSHMKLTKVKGAVAGMFVYHPEGEIDIEVVSALNTPQTYFAVHPGLTEHGRASSLTHGNWEYDFDPTENYHEYRYDWFPGIVLFYVDGIERYKMTTNILDKPGRIMFNHWTDGNANFSQGPVKENAFLHIKNMTFFFNSTETPLSCTKTQNTCTVQSVISDIQKNTTAHEGMLGPLVTTLPSNSSTSSSTNLIPLLTAFMQPFGVIQRLALISFFAILF